MEELVPFAIWDDFERILISYKEWKVIYYIYILFLGMAASLVKLKLLPYKRNLSSSKRYT
jgi:hypothetical protein